MAEAVAKQSPGKNVFSAESEARPASWGIDDDGYGSAQRHEWRRNPSAAYLRDPVRYLKEFLIEMNCPYEPEIQSKSDGDGDGDVADDDSGFSARKQAKPREITVRITLPVDNASGNALYGIGQSLRKKEAERLACLDALDELDKNGYLNSHDDGRSSRREKRRSNKQESDDEFEDEFYDRTKTASKRRSDNKPETFESLSKKLQMAERDIEQMQRDIDTLNNSAVDGSSKEAQEEDGDELDVYMNALEKGQQVSARKQMEGKLAELEKEKARLAALLKLVAPDEPVVSKKRECREIQVERAEVQEPASGQAEPGPEPKRQRQSHGPTLRQVVDSQKQADKASFEERTREAKHEDEAGYHQDSETVEWQPPAGQTGDGRTSLNDKLGY
ncbi:hypothetical protein LPJ56_005876 [Coemansia sp. RSA 2599]|nr:hypothetical protein LPJ75_005866 [Coemansia sp. RSA 2598]KAJ1810595.1 hypothetical protein LPJ56_005876 [Coemansia sp. RSA 2599]